MNAPKRKTDWCSDQTNLGAHEFSEKRKYVRCPTCNRRLIPKAMPVEPNIKECMESIYTIPRHKAK